VTKLGDLTVLKADPEAQLPATVTKSRF